MTLFTEMAHIYDERKIKIKAQQQGLNFVTFWNLKMFSRMFIKPAGSSYPFRKRES